MSAPVLHVLAAAVDAQQGAVRLRIHTHAGQCFQLEFTARLAANSGRELIAASEHGHRKTPVSDAQRAAAGLPLTKPGGGL